MNNSILNILSIFKLLLLLSILSTGLVSCKSGGCSEKSLIGGTYKFYTTNAFGGEIVYTLSLNEDETVRGSITNDINGSHPIAGSWHIYESLDHMQIDFTYTEFSSEYQSIYIRDGYVYMREYDMESKINGDELINVDK